MRRALAAGLLSVAVGCTRSDRPADAVRAFMAPGASPDLAREGRFFEQGGPGVLRYLGVDLDPSEVEAGSPLTLTHVLEVEVAFRSNPQLFVHLDDVGGARVAVHDHPVVEGRVPLHAMKPGERWLDRHRMVIPYRARSGTSRLFVGLFDGDERMTLETQAGRNDGRDRLWVTEVEIRGEGPPPLPLVTAPRTDAPIAPDGVLDEPAWAEAEILTFTDSLGRDRPTRYPTRLRLLYGAEHLYVGFEAEDEDISERFAKRDDPIYEHETVELFLMPNVAAPDLGPYVELQASPTGVIFDASFRARRQGMNVGFDADQRVGTTRDGTLNDDRPDRGWVSEWAVPFAALPGVERAPEPGDEWRMNAFRIEKHRVGQRLEAEYTAWSPPRVGDFHATDRFGRLRFGGRVEER